MSEQTNDTKVCPYCAETIKAEAIVCRFCGRDLVEKPASPVQAPVDKQATNSTRKAILVLVGIIVLLCMLFSFINRGKPNTGSTISNPSVLQPTTYKVKYEIIGNPRNASLTYENESGNTEQADVRLPWTEEFTASEGDFLYISAQLDGNGSITCKIYLDGVVWEEATSKGEFVIASCSGSAGD